MKNILALGICLAAFNAYAQDTQEVAQDISTINCDEQTKTAIIEEAYEQELPTTLDLKTQEIAEEVAEQATEEVVADAAEEIVSETTKEALTEMSEDLIVEQDAQETYTVTMKNNDGSEVNVQAQVITLAETKELFNSPEGVEFFASKGMTSAEAFDSIVAFLGQIQNKTIEIEGNVVPLDGISLVINDNNYFIKASEFLALNGDYVEIQEEESDLNN